MHGDLHPGNILVQGADGVSPSLEMQQQQVNDTLMATIAPALSPLRLVLLDAGIVAKLQASDLRNFRAVFQAVVMGQVRPLAFRLLGNECFAPHPVSLVKAHHCQNALVRATTARRENTSDYTV